MAVKKKTVAKKSNVSFIKTVCCLAFVVSAIGLCYSAYYNSHDTILWIMILALNGVGIFSPDEIKK